MKKTVKYKENMYYKSCIRLHNRKCRHLNVCKNICSKLLVFWVSWSFLIKAALVSKILHTELVKLHICVIIGSSHCDLNSQ